MNQPNKFTIKKPRITLSEEQKNQARAGMAGEAVKESMAPTSSALESPILEAAPVVPVPLPIEPVSAPTPETVAEAIIPARQGRGSRGRKTDKNPGNEPEDDGTQHVRMSKDLVLQAKMNILQLPRGYGIKNLRDYGDAAFAFFEAHLRKTGKLPSK